MAEFKHYLGSVAFQIDEAILGPLVGNLESK
jgi:hypothetical protein